MEMPGKVPTANLDNWITDFKERIFKRYWVLTDMDYNGALGATLSFLTIKKFHPLAEIFDCRIEFGPQSAAMGRFLHNFNAIGKRVGRIGEHVDDLMLTWRSSP